MCVYMLAATVNLKERDVSINDGYNDSHPASNLITTSNNADYSRDTVESLSLPSDKHNDILNKGIKLTIKVHLIYDEFEFPKRIQAGDFTEFYTKVFSALLNKKPGSRPCHLQYQFGAKWYDLSEDTGFDDMCMDEDNPEISIKATSSPVESTLLGIAS